MKILSGFIVITCFSLFSIFHFSKNNVQLINSEGKTIKERFVLPSGYVRQKKPTILLEAI